MICTFSTFKNNNKSLYENGWQISHVSQCHTDINSHSNEKEKEFSYNLIFRDEADVFFP